MTIRSFAYYLSDVLNNIIRIGQMMSEKGNIPDSTVADCHTS